MKTLGALGSTEPMEGLLLRCLGKKTSLAESIASATVTSILDRSFAFPIKSLN